MENRDFMERTMKNYNAFVFRCVRVTEECGYGIVDNMPGMTVRCSKDRGRPNGCLKIYRCTQHEKKIYRTLEEGHCYLCLIDAMKEGCINAAPLYEIYSDCYGKTVARTERSILESTVEEIFMAAGGNDMEKEKLVTLQRAFGLKYIAGVYDIKVKTAYGNWMYNLLSGTLMHENFCGLRNMGNKGFYEQGWHIQKTRDNLTDFYKALSYIVNHDFGFRRSGKNECGQRSLHTA